MPEPTDRARLVRDAYDAWLAADRDRVEALYAPDFTFSSPVDPQLDRAGWFERCWPGAGTNVTRFDFTRLIESGDEVLVSYIATRPDGSRFQNTEIVRFADERIVRTEVYFGWDLDASDAGS